MPTPGERIIGHVHNALVNSVFNVSTTVVPFDMGTFPVDKFSGLGGIFSSVGSLTFRMQFGPSSGTYFVSSTSVINSGGNILDVVNYGAFVNFGFTAAVSCAAGVYIYGEPIR
jgi:hypothetical protein